MSFHSWLQNLGAALARNATEGVFYNRDGGRRKRTQRGSLRAATPRLKFEILEDRSLLAFLAPVNYDVGPNPQAVVMGDFNGDGQLDLAAANPVPGTVSVLLGDGAGGFGTAIESDVGAVFHHSDGHLEAGISLTVADFDNDGHLDLAMASHFQNYETGDFYGAVGVNMGNGDGTFRAATHPFNNGLVLSVAAEDFNNDGKSDLAVNFLAPGFSFGEFYGQHEVLLGNGQGGFTAAGMSGYAHGEALLSPAVGDLNRDGIVDVVLVQAGGQGGDVLLGSGAGGPTFLYLRSNYYTTNQNARAIAIGDFTGDGVPDLVVAGDGWYTDEPNGVDVVTGSGYGTFDSPITHSANGNMHTGVAVADFNGDGLLDAVTSDADTGTVSELLGNGNGTLTYTGAFAVGSSPMAVVVGDFNGDGRPDVATANGGSNTVSVLLNAAHDNRPWLRIRDVTLTEGNTGAALAGFVVTLSAASADTVTVAYATSDSTATAGSDYRAAAGTLTFVPGETSKTVSVQVNGDRNDEYSNESFFVNLSGATGASIADGQGVGTIVEDEPRFSIGGGTVAEGNSGTKNVTLTVTMAAAYDVPVTVNYATQDLSATSASGDYQAKTGTLSFNPGGPLTRNITVLVNGDRLPETNETFAVNLGWGGYGIATIVDDEPRISIGDVTKAEGKKSQTTLFTFTVTLSAAYDQSVTMSFQTANGTATTGDSDYLAKAGTLTFAPGETTKTITIEVKGDSKKESNETFYLDLFGNSGNSLFTKKRGLGTILNDD